MERHLRQRRQRAGFGPPQTALEPFQISRQDGSQDAFSEEGAIVNHPLFAPEPPGLELNNFDLARRR